MAVRTVFLQFQSNAGTLSAQLNAVTASIRGMEAAEKQATLATATAGQTLQKATALQNDYVTSKSKLVQASQQHTAATKEEANAQTALANLQKSSSTSEDQLVAAKTRLITARKANTAASNEEQTALKVETQLKQQAATATAQSEAATLKAQTANDKYATSIKNSSQVHDQALASIGKMSALIGGAIVAGFAAATDAAVKWQQQMAQIQAQTGLTNTELTGLSNTLLSLSQRVPVSAGALAQAFINISKEGFNAAQSVQILNQAAVTAVATGGDIQTAANNLGILMNTFQLNMVQAVNATNMLEKATTLTHGSISDLTQGLVYLAPSLQLAHIGLSDAAASMVALSEGGLTANQSGMALSRFILQISKDGSTLSNVMTAVANSQGVANKSFKDGADVIGYFGLTGTMQLLNKATGDQINQLETLYPSIRAFRGVAAEQVNGMSDLLRAQHALNNETQNAIDAQKRYQAQTNTVSAQLKIMTNDFHVAAVGIGNDFLPFLKILIQGAQDIINAFLALPKPVQEAAVAFGAIVGVFLLIGGAWAALRPIFSSFSDILGIVKSAIGLTTPVVDTQAAALEIMTKAVNDLTVATQNLTTAQAENKLGMQAAMPTEEAQIGLEEQQVAVEEQAANLHFGPAYTYPGMAGETTVVPEAAGAAVPAVETAGGAAIPAATEVAAPAAGAAVPLGTEVAGIAGGVGGAAVATGAATTAETAAVPEVAGVVTGLGAAGAAGGESAGLLAGAAGAIGAVGTAALVAAPLVIGAVAAITALNHSAQGKEAVKQYGQAWQAETTGLKGSVEAHAQAAEYQDKLLQHAKALGTNIGDLTTAIVGTTGGLQAQGPVLQAQNNLYTDFTNKIGLSTDQLKAQGVSQDEINRLHKDTSAAIGGSINSWRDLNNQYQALSASGVTFSKGSQQTVSDLHHLTEEVDRSEQGFRKQQKAIADNKPAMDQLEQSLLAGTGDLSSMNQNAVVFGVTVAELTNQIKGLQGQLKQQLDPANILKSAAADASKLVDSGLSGQKTFQDVLTDAQTKARQAAQDQADANKYLTAVAIKGQQDQITSLQTQEKQLQATAHASGTLNDAQTLNTTTIARLKDQEKQHTLALNELTKQQNLALTQSVQDNADTLQVGLGDFQTALTKSAQAQQTHMYSMKIIQQELEQDLLSGSHQFATTNAADIQNVLTQLGSLGPQGELLIKQLAQGAISGAPAAIAPLQQIVQNLLLVKPTSPQPAAIDVRTEIKSQADKVTKFVADLSKLAAMGLPSLVAWFEQAGPDSADALDSIMGDTTQLRALDAQAQKASLYYNPNDPNDTTAATQAISQINKIIQVTKQGAKKISIGDLVGPTSDPQVQMLVQAFAQQLIAGGLLDPKVWLAYNTANAGGQGVDVGSRSAPQQLAQQSETGSPQATAQTLNTGISSAGTTSPISGAAVPPAFANPQAGPAFIRPPVTGAPAPSGSPAGGSGVTLPPGTHAWYLAHSPDPYTSRVSIPPQYIRYLTRDAQGKYWVIIPSPGFQAPHGERVLGHQQVIPEAEGGILKAYAEGHEAEIAPAGAMRVWAEPETGGEAYIPMAPDKRGRSTGILNSVADHFGYNLVPHAEGGIQVNPFASMTKPKAIHSIAAPEVRFTDGGMHGPEGMLLGEHMESGGIQVNPFASLTKPKAIRTIAAPEVRFADGGVVAPETLTGAAAAGAFIESAPGVAGIITGIARSVGVSPDLAIAIATVESGLDPNAKGDYVNGQPTSFGLYQLHWGGELNQLGTTLAAASKLALDPARNAKVALAHVAAVAHAHPHLDPGVIAALAQGPSDKAGYAKQVDALLGRKTGAVSFNVSNVPDWKSSTTSGKSQDQSDALTPPFGTWSPGAQQVSVGAGWDLQALPGTPVLAAAPGQVRYGHDKGKLGDPYPFLELDQPYKHHLGVYYGYVQPRVPDGTAVGAGEQIAATATGRGASTSPSLELGFWDSTPVYSGADIRSAFIMAQTKQQKKPGQVDKPTGPGGSGRDVVALRRAMGEFGKPYEWGAAGPNAFDCSGLVDYSFQLGGHPTTYSLVGRGTKVDLGNQAPGDLVFFNEGTGNPPEHVGIVVSGDTMIDAPHSGASVEYDSISGWGSPVFAIRRLAAGGILGGATMAPWGGHMVPSAPPQAYVIKGDGPLSSSQQQHVGGPDARGRYWMGSGSTSFVEVVPRSRVQAHAEGHMAEIATSGARLWAEPETGGEAYIPLTSSKRGRSTQILGQVAGHFGYDLHPQAEGGYYPPGHDMSGSRSASSAPIVHSTTFHQEQVTNSTNYQFSGPIQGYNLEQVTRDAERKQRYAALQGAL